MHALSNSEPASNGKQSQAVQLEAPFFTVVDPQQEKQRKDRPPFFERPEKYDIFDANSIHWTALTIDTRSVTRDVFLHIIRRSMGWGCCWETYSSVGENLDIKRHRASDAVKELVELAVLEIRQWKRQGRLVDYYIVRPPLEWPESAFKHDSEGNSEGWKYWRKIRGAVAQKRPDQWPDSGHTTGLKTATISQRAPSQVKEVQEKSSSSTRTREADDDDSLRSNGNGNGNNSNQSSVTEKTVSEKLKKLPPRITAEAFEAACRKQGLADGPNKAGLWKRLDGLAVNNPEGLLKKAVAVEVANFKKRKAGSSPADKVASCHPEVAANKRIMQETGRLEAIWAAQEKAKREKEGAKV